MDANRKGLARELVDDVEQHYLRCQLQRGPKSALSGNRADSEY
jgi:hypothetical protein